MSCISHDAIVVPDERMKMDRARQRFADNVDLLTKFNPELAVMGDRDWTNACTNEYVQHMAKKLWMHPFTDQEVEHVNKAVSGYLLRERRRAEAQPQVPGGRVVKGEVFSVKKACDHTNCRKHYKMNIRDHEYKNTLYTPIPEPHLPQDPETLVGADVSFYAYITVSERDNTFGFAHKPKLMEIKKVG